VGANSIVFIQDEADFVTRTIQDYSQNRSPSNFTATESGYCVSILQKVRGQQLDPSQTPISFTPEESSLMQYLYINLLSMRGKPAGDLDWTYWQHFDINTQALIINVIRKIGGQMPSLPTNSYPSGPGPWSNT
jgi:hypothetical protein